MPLETGLVFVAHVQYWIFDRIRLDGDVTVGTMPIDP